MTAKNMGRKKGWYQNGNKNMKEIILVVKRRAYLLSGIQMEETPEQKYILGVSSDKSGHIMKMVKSKPKKII